MFRSYLCYATLLAAFACGSFAQAETIYGLTDGGNLVTIDSLTHAVETSRSITGISGLGEKLLSIDIRPKTGELYGLSSAGRFYRINMGSGAATPVGNALAALMVDTIKSFDFDPTSDTMRVLTGSGKNLRVNPANGAGVLDTNLKFVAGDPHFGQTPAVVTAAFTNSYAGAPSTTLYTLEGNLDLLARLSPQNQGLLQTVAPVNYNLGTLLSVNGFDISGATGIGYVVGSALLDGGLSPNTLYTINLATGQIALSGPIANALVASPQTGGGHSGGGSSGGGGIWCDGKDVGSLIDITTCSVVPEPSTGLLALVAVAGVVGNRLRRRKTVTLATSLPGKSKDKTPGAVPSGPRRGFFVRCLVLAYFNKRLEQRRVTEFPPHQGPLSGMHHPVRSLKDEHIADGLQEFAERLRHLDVQIGLVHRLQQRQRAGPLLLE